MLKGRITNARELRLLGMKIPEEYPDDFRFRCEGWKVESGDLPGEADAVLSFSALDTVPKHIVIDFVLSKPEESKQMTHKLTAVGVGSAFVDSSLWQSMFLMEAPSGKKLLIDCGSDARHALKELNLSYLDIDAVYISHLHSDHVGGLEWLALCSYFDKRYAEAHGGLPKLFINTDLARECWSRSLQGGLLTLQMEKAKLETFFDVKKIATGGSFRWEGLFFQTVQVVHIVSNFSFSNSYGLIVTKDRYTEGETLPSFNLQEMEDGKGQEGQTHIFITTDTQFAPNQLIDYYKSSDIIIHDCETYPFKSGVHAHYDELKGLPDDIKKKMHLVHYNPNFSERDPQADGFVGFLEKGFTIEL